MGPDNLSNQSRSDNILLPAQHDGQTIEFGIDSMPAVIVPNVMFDDIYFYVFRRENILNDTVNNINNDLCRLFHRRSSFFFAFHQIGFNLSQVICRFGHSDSI
jgi:hypothetical protein